MKDKPTVEEFLKMCRVNGDEKIDTNDDSFWKLKDLFEHYKDLYQEKVEEKINQNQRNEPTI